MRLRFINGSAMTIFDVAIPELRMLVVAADGMPVLPVPVDEFRIGNGETYDVLVTPPAARAYTIMAEPIDRSGFARGTLAPRQGMSGPIPALRPRTVLTMADMGMAHGGMDMGGGANPHAGHAMPMPSAPASNPHAGHAMPMAPAGAANPHAGHAMPMPSAPPTSANPTPGTPCPHLVLRPMAGRWDGNSPARRRASARFAMPTCGAWLPGTMPLRRRARSWFASRGR